MNSYELAYKTADEIENRNAEYYVANMLRQQADRIAELEREVGSLKISLGNTELLLDESFDRTASHMAGEYVSYTAMTLTDKEIHEIYAKLNCQVDRPIFVIDFARAILKKASEK